MINVGVTGHQDVPAQAESFARVHINDALDAIDEPIKGVSSLAAGADQMFASIVIERGYPLHAVLPCHNYFSSFSKPNDLLLFNNLLSQATEKEILQYKVPSEEAFLNAGRRLVDISDIILAVWDGQSAKGKGGTADVVKYAIDHGKQVIRIWPKGVER